MRSTSRSTLSTFPADRRTAPALAALPLPPWRRPRGQRWLARETSTSGTLAASRSICRPSFRWSESFEYHHLADRLAFVQQVKAVVDLVERQAARQQLVYRQASLLVQVDKAWDVARRYARTDVAAFYRTLFGNKTHRGQRPARGRRRQPGGDGRSPTTRDAVREIQRADRT